MKFAQKPKTREEKQVKSKGGSGDVAEPRQRALCSPQCQSLRRSFPMPGTCVRTHTRTVHGDHEGAAGDRAQSHVLSVPASFSRLAV